MTVFALSEVIYLSYTVEDEQGSGQLHIIERLVVSNKIKIHESLFLTINKNERKLLHCFDITKLPSVCVSCPGQGKVRKCPENTLKQ